MTAKASKPIPIGRADGISNPVVVTVIRQMSPAAGMERSVPNPIPHTAVIRYCKSWIARSFPLVNPMVLRIPIFV